MISTQTLTRYEFQKNIRKKYSGCKIFEKGAESKSRNEKKAEINSNRKAKI